MKFKGEENKVIWESFRGGVMNERFDDEMDDDFGDDMGDDDDYGMMDDDPDFGEGGFDSEGDDFGDDDEPEAHGMVMEFDPISPVEKHEVNEVLVSELKKLAEYANRLYEMRNDCEFEDWMVSAITISSTYVSDVWHRLDAKADFANTGFENVNEGYDVGNQDYDDLEYDSDKMNNFPDSTTDYNVMKFRNYVTEFIHGDGMKQERAKNSLKKMYMKYKNDPAFMYNWKDAFGNDKI